MLNIIRLFAFSFCLYSSSLSFAQTPSATGGMSKMYGEIGVVSNYVDRGLTQSNKAPSIEAGLGYWFGSQGRIGFQAASVNYPSESASVQMRLLGEYKFIFSQNSDLRIRNDFVRYFSETKRNKVWVTLDQNFFTYHVLYSYEDNFEGTKTPRSWFAFHHEFPYGPTYGIDATAGYSMVGGYNNYFDTRVGLKYTNSNLTAGIYNTYVSAASQFGGSADVAFFLVVNAKF